TAEVVSTGGPPARPGAEVAVTATPPAVIVPTNARRVMSLLASSSMGASPLGARAVSSNSRARRAMRVELSGGLQDVHRAHRAGPVALGGEGPREDSARASPCSEQGRGRGA